ncbi:hypothetical protein ABEF95_002376 [Exophiala dermatitidis]
MVRTDKAWPLASAVVEEFRSPPSDTTNQPDPLRYILDAVDGRLPGRATCLAEIDPTEAQIWEEDLLWRHERKLLEYVGWRAGDRSQTSGERLEEIAQATENMRRGKDASLPNKSPRDKPATTVAEGTPGNETAQPEQTNLEDETVHPEDGFLEETVQHGGLIDSMEGMGIDDAQEERLESDPPFTATAADTVMQDNEDGNGGHSDEPEYMSDTSSAPEDGHDGDYMPESQETEEYEVEEDDFVDDIDDAIDDDIDDNNEEYEDDEDEDAEDEDQEDDDEEHEEDDDQDETQSTCLTGTSTR